MNTQQDTEIIAIASGKGGTGKTLITASIGYVLTHSGLRVLMIDADAGTDGLSLFLLGPKGWMQLKNFNKENTYLGAISSADEEMLLVEPRRIYRNVAREDDDIEYEALISGRGIYGDVSGSLDDLHIPKDQFRRAVAALFDRLRARRLYDYILVDTRGGFGMESTDICALADSFIVVTEANLTNLYQDRNLIRRINTTAQQLDRNPLLRTIIVNKATEGEEQSFRNLLTREFEPLRYEETHAIPLDIDAMKAYKTQHIPYRSSPASPFSYTSLTAFSDVFHVVTSRWDGAHVQKWNQLTKSISDAIETHNQRIEEEEEASRKDFETRKKREKQMSQRMWAATASAVFALVLLMGSLVSTIADGGKRNDATIIQLYTADIPPAQKVTNLLKLYESGTRTFDYIGLPEVNLSAIDLTEVRMRSSVLKSARLNRATLFGADLRNANLENADLEGANLRGANLTEANLRNAKLKDVQLQGANLKGASFANMDWEQLSQAITDETTVLPNGAQGPYPQKFSDPIPDLPAFSKQMGYIWIGDYDKKSRTWTRPQLEYPDGRELTSPPKTLSKGMIFNVRGSMVVREGVPKNDEGYYQNQKKLSVILRGREIMLLSTPVAIPRRHAVQYWARVRETSFAEPRVPSR